MWDASTHHPEGKYKVKNYVTPLKLSVILLDDLLKRYAELAFDVHGHRLSMRQAGRFSVTGGRCLHTLAHLQREGAAKCSTSHQQCVGVT